MPTFRGLLAPTAYADGVPGATDRMLFETQGGLPRGIAPSSLVSGFAHTLVDVREHGTVGNGSTNDLTALNAAVTAAVSGGKRGVWLPKATGYAVTGPWVIPATLDVIQEAPVIYTGSSNVACIQIGATATQAFQRTYRLWARRSTVSDWSNEASIGIDLINPNQSKIEVVEASGFTIGLKVHGLSAAADTGATWSTYHLYYFAENGCDVDLCADGIGGFVNQNTFIGGSFNSSTGEPNPTQAKIGIRLRMVNSADSLPNNNTFINPAFEFHYTARTGDVIPVHILNGRYNSFLTCRHESNKPLFMRVAGNSWDNVAEIAYTEQTNFAALLEDTQVGYNLVLPQQMKSRQLRYETAMPVLTFASPVAWDLYRRPRAQLTLTGNTTINVSDTSDIGDFRDIYTLLVLQDGTGGRTLTLGTGFVSSPATASLQSAANAATLLTFVGNGSALILAPPQMGAFELAGTFDGNGNPIIDYTMPHVAGVSGLLTQAAHGGRAVHITGNVTVPVANGFICEIRNKDATTRTVAPASGSLIHNGVKLAAAATISLPQYRVVVVKSDGTDVWVYGAIA